jgi:DNA-binding protein HU-beta
MNKEELVAAIAEITEFSKADSKRFLEAFTEATTRALTDGETLQLVGFATFSVGDRAERKGRNPQTGKEITIPASKVVKFSAGKQLKEAVNNSKDTKKKKKK